jgi:hypothetical protein
MKPEDVLSYEMDIGWPEVLIAVEVPIVSNSSEVIVKGIEPDVNGVFRIIWHRDSPFHSGTSDTQILKPLFDEARDFVHPTLRADKCWILFVEVEQGLLIGRKLEKITSFSNNSGFLATVRANFVVSFFERDVIR